MASAHQQLQVGQTVRLTYLESGSHIITVLPPDQPGPQVLETGPDYLLLEEPAQGVKTCIPAYLIQAVELPATQEQHAA